MVPQSRSSGASARFWVAVSLFHSGLVDVPARGVATRAADAAGCAAETNGHAATDNASQATAARWVRRLVCNSISLVALTLEEGDEPWVAIGSRRKLIRKQCGVNLGGNVDLLLFMVVLDQHQSNDQDDQRHDRHEAQP